MTNAHVTSLTTDDAGKVTGIRYRQGGEGGDIDLPAASVVLTTGGACFLYPTYIYTSTTQITIVLYTTPATTLL